MAKGSNRVVELPRTVAELERIGERLDANRKVMLQFVAALKVRDRTGVLRVLRPNAAQMAFEARRGRQNIVLKARQMGMTTWVAARFFLRTVTHRGMLTLQVAHTQSAAEGIFRTVQRMWEELPKELREGALRRSRSNVGQMVFPELDSEFRVASAGDPGAGRGLSVQNLHCSEVSRWPGDVGETLAGLRASLAPGGELVLESTPNGAYGVFYEAWLSGLDASRANGGLVRHFLPWWLEPAYVGEAVERAAMHEDELQLVEEQGLTARQIGFRRGLQGSYGVLRAQEFAEDAETCFRATGGCYFGVASIERRLAEVPPPVAVERNGALQVWLGPLAGREYVVAVDPAGGGADGDFAAVQVVDRATGLQCAELQERLRPADLARVCVGLAKRYNGALLAIERNNHGLAVIARVETTERYERMYRQGGEVGWLTTVLSKPSMVEQVGAVLEHGPEQLQSRRLLAECRTFLSGERGKTAAAAGSHDDLVMAMGLALAVRSEGLGSSYPLLATG
jgi:hypothetical protein